MEKAEYTAAVKAFRQMTSCYRAQKRQLDLMKSHCQQVQENRRNYDEADGDDALYELLDRKTKEVEDVFQKIEDKYGALMSAVLWEQYVENRKQIDVAVRYGYSLRTMQRMISICLHDVLETGMES